MTVARWHLAEVLPVPKQEYLAIDVMAFLAPTSPAGGGLWRFLNWRIDQICTSLPIACGR